MQQPITILRENFGGRGPLRDEIDADVEGCWGIHPTPILNDHAWTLTHIPSGHAFLSGVLEGQARACRAELLAGALDWSGITQPSDMTAAHKRVGKALRKKYEAVK